MKWIKIHKNLWLGLWWLGFVFFFMQELPYAIMPFIKSANPLMKMIDTYPVLNIIEKIAGISTVIAMIFIVNPNAKRFPLDSIKERIYLLLSVLLLLGYYVGWVLYFNGYQSLCLVLIMLVGFVPLYYTFIGLWRKNYILVCVGILFLFAHIANVWTSYVI